MLELVGGKSCFRVLASGFGLSEEETKSGQQPQEHAHTTRMLLLLNVLAPMFATEGAS